jgi:hypothetical protein
VTPPVVLTGYAFDGQLLAGLMFGAALVLLWIGLRRRPPRPDARRRAELSVEREGDRPPPSADGPRGPWG